MTDHLNHFPNFLHFLEQVEASADRVAWSSRRVRDELRGERRQRMERADYELYKLLSNANRFLDHLARSRVITEEGSDRLASFLLTSARAVIRETRSANAWGWAPKHDRREEAETVWIRAQVKTFEHFGGEAMARLMLRLMGDSCGKH